MRRRTFTLGAAAAALLAGTARGDTMLGVSGGEFTLDGKRVFLLGASLYGALAAADEALRRDLDGLRERGFNWIRVWANWAAFENDVAAVDREGRPRPEYLEKLGRLAAECDRRGMALDVSLSRGNGITGPPRLQSREAHRRAAEALVTALRPHRNWYLDLANERNVRDRRFAAFEELRELREAVRQLDPARLVTASHAGDIPREEVREYLLTVRVDLLCPHRPRNAASAGQTEARTREYRAWMEALGRVVPLHYQEPFRRGYADWQPAAAEFLLDLRGARAGGAAGWCFHNGDQRDRPDGRPRRGFDLREGQLLDQLDAEERRVVQEAAAAR